MRQSHIDFQRDVTAMAFIPGFSTSASIMTGGVLATGIAVIAESITSDPALGTGSLMLGGAGLIAAVSAFAKEFWNDRQKQREFELAKYRLTLRNDRQFTALHALYNWARTARATVSALPQVPEFDLTPEGDHESDQNHPRVSGLDP